MKKSKIVMLCASLCVCLCALFIGVWSATQASMSLGGTISFTATGIYADISAATLKNNTGTVTGKMQAISLSAENDGAAAIATWSGLTLAFNENGDDVEVEFTITNKNTNRYLEVTLTKTEGAQENATSAITLNGNAVTKVAIPKQETGKTNNVATVKIVFKVTNKNLDASITNFNFKFDLQNVENPTT